MPKATTTSLQETIRKIGTNLGFQSTVETTLIADDCYSPRHDVVWRLPINELVPKTLSATLLGSPNHPWAHFLQSIPVAAFEIEGSTPTSKNQLGNFANLYSSPALFGFAVVDNAGAGRENDTYRRGVRIARSFRQMLGARSVFFLDKHQLCAVKNPPRSILRTVTADSCAGVAPGKKGTGGETKSIPVAANIFKAASSSGLHVGRDVRPEQMEWAYSVVRHLSESLPDCQASKFMLGRNALWDPVSKNTSQIKKADDYFYIPKIDVMLTFPFPPAFTAWMRDLGRVLDGEVWNYPLLHYLKLNNQATMRCPLVAIEIETGAGKHANGGVVNMSSNAFMGILVAPTAAKPHLEALKRGLGLQNVFFRDIRVPF